MSTNNFFTKLNGISLTDQIKKNQGLNYISWASAEAELKKIDPYAKIERLNYVPKVLLGDQIVDGEPRPYWVVGNTAEVRTRITLNAKRVYEALGLQYNDGDPEEIVEEMWLPVMNLRKQPVTLDAITSMDVNKATMRCVVKNIAVVCGLGLHVYDGEDISDDDQAIQKLQTSCYELIGKKCKVGDAQKKKVAEICKELLPEQNGDPKLCQDKDVLEELKKKLLAVR